MSSPTGKTCGPDQQIAWNAIIDAIRSATPAGTPADTIIGVLSTALASHMSAAVLGGEMDESRIPHVLDFVQTATTDFMKVTRERIARLPTKGNA